MRSRRASAAAALLALVAACGAFAAEAATIRFSGPRTATAGGVWRASISVRPAPKLAPRVEARLGGAVARMAVRRAGAGRYALSASFRRPGTWRLVATAGGRRHRLGTVTVRLRAIRLQSVLGIALHADGGLLIADGDSRRVVRVDLATGLLATFAAGPLIAPTAVTVARDGSVFVADRGAGGVFRVANGAVTRWIPYGDALAVAVDSVGNVYSSGREHTVVRRDAATGAVTRYAGTGEEGSSGNGDPASAARVFAPHGLAVDPHDDLVIAEVPSVRRVDRATGVINAIAGNGVRPLCREEGPALEVCLTALRVAFETDGDFWVTDPENRRLWRFARGVARAFDLGFPPFDVVVEPVGSLLVADNLGRRVVRFDPATAGTSVVVPPGGG